MHGRAWAGAACAALWAGLAWPIEAAAQTAPQPSPASRIAWQTLARSVENRVIEYCRFGEGDEHVLVVAPLAGDEYEGVELAERLASHLEQFPRRLDDTTVTIVRDPNPDGRFRRTAANARGVLIDQNFRTRHWRKTPHGDRWLSGKEPESEPETRALADLFDDLKPSRVVVLGSSRRPGVLNYAGPAEQLSLQVAELARMRSLP
ncbi:MAG TPA: M14 family zinc carboxypeptidase, partial [Pirellulales bacterium]|nr:M14 family zinc carboxypeptidase [Pirellulales bacterium]